MALDIQYLPVITAVLAAITIGFVWYLQQFGFGKPWMHLTGRDATMPESAKGSATRGYISNSLVVSLSS